MRTKFATLVLVFAVSVCFGRVYSPWVNSQLIPDWSGNWQSFLQYPSLQGKTGNDLAIGIFDILQSKTLGAYHVSGQIVPRASGTTDGGQIWAYYTIRDPVRIMNMCGWGYCGALSGYTSGTMQQCGVGNTRVLEISGGAIGAHSVAEAYYGGDWHYFDLDLRGYNRQNTDGIVASWQESDDNPSYWDSLFCSDLTGLRNAATANTLGNTAKVHRGWESGHTMDFVLRMGETFTRYWKADSTRYYNTIYYWTNFPHIGAAILSTSIGSVPKDYGMVHSGRPESWCNGHKYCQNGMGIYKYTPNLGSGYGDYQDGVYQDSNVVQDEDGIGPASGSGWMEFDFFSPYIIIGKNGIVLADLQNVRNQTEGATASITIQGTATLKASQNNGYQWTTLQNNVSSGTYASDFTTMVYGRHSYRLRIELQPGAKLTGFSNSTAVECGQVTLPLVNGTTQMSYRMADKLGYNTTPMFIDIDLGDPVTANLPATITNHQPTNITQRATQAVVPVKVPDGCAIRWLSVGGAFQRSAGTQIQISTTGPTSGFSTVWSSSAYASCDYADCHWRLQFDTTYVFASNPPNQCWVRYTNNVNMVRIYVHYEEPNRPIQNSQVRITHCTGTNTNTVEQVVSANANYNVNLTGENLWYKMEVESQLSSAIQEGIEKQAVESVEITPNPFNPAVTISVGVQNFEPLQILIYTISGRMITDLSKQMVNGKCVWNAGNMPSGLYILKVCSGNTAKYKTMTLLK
ncbi:MAG: hypothetical protein A2350_00580 [Candidatus Raymondbacteria bacterium RifOxyB12_full_50_8]|uniref:Secretion system C-terminal sorting domain-containing protein n=1 Tax=Candidatus Raymondbacteria bacterium RIFOXYD12_FULL_49_13 TaxID=1817890 RepID=A0A1F7FGL3_UNCRA|nr:MAG: hypothetical protein A2248_04900 [Candidatus Raymondbacteria bacterium RIFOXYA2_FULL_49_16]OGK00676.1 MAG: hypothetical protein A2350_00580 [Candidatus Raymondbacteria bacterium RifOxyB12_full_50_8]OGK05835.1 MAG: hypothetical protein A2519_04075 [Candidatus Raymondbacteria bacterium RIFOXYD12_FULL_49_13]OGP43328.1 MAG: hypothetical protein A2324_02540 [Candidatus Raymondbacteria bacterium RIFOXYB2_FULL_49_35]